MSLPVETLRKSFERVVELSPNLTTRFYEILFARYPRTRAMFGRHSQAKQEKMLTDALVAVISHLEDGEWLTTTLGGLRVDGSARVAPGVFAAGADAGGISTGGYSGGLAAALVFGRLAAETALR